MHTTHYLNNEKEQNKVQSNYLPRPHGFQGGEVPDPNLAAVTGGEEKSVVGTKCQRRDGFRVAIDGRPYRGIGGFDDLDGLTASTNNEGAVGRYYDRPATVELLQRRYTSIASLER